MDARCQQPNVVHGLQRQTPFMYERHETPLALGFLRSNSFIPCKLLMAIVDVAWILQTQARGA